MSPNLLNLPPIKKVGIKQDNKIRLINLKRVKIQRVSLNQTCIKETENLISKNTIKNHWLLIMAKWFHTLVQFVSLMICIGPNY